MPIDFVFQNADPLWWNQYKSTEAGEWSL